MLESDREVDGSLAAACVGAVLGGLAHQDGERIETWGAELFADAFGGGRPFGREPL